MGGKVLVVGSNQLAQIESFVERMHHAKVSLVWMTPSVLRLLTDTCALPSSLTDILL